MDNAKLFHFDKKALRDECIKRGEIVEEQVALLKTMRIIIDSLDLSSDGEELISRVDESISRARELA